MENSKKTGIVVGTFLLGAAVGGILGILFAPEKGSKTREAISDKTDDLFGDMKGKFNDLLEDVKKEAENVKNRTNVFLENTAEKLN